MPWSSERKKTANLARVSAWLFVRLWLVCNTSILSGVLSERKNNLNGAPNGSGTLSTTIADAGTAVRIGSRDDLVTKMKGSLDEVVIYNRALSGGEIAAMYEERAWDGNHTLSVTAYDSAAQSGSDSVNFTISSVGGITLSASGYKVKGVHHADLTWSGATSANVDVFRNGAVVATTPNDGAYTDNTGQKGSGSSYTYQVCEAGTSTCSNVDTVNF